MLAGTVRHIAELELTGRGDPMLTDLAGPYLDPASIWRAWARMSAG